MLKSFSKVVKNDGDKYRSVTNIVPKCVADIYYTPFCFYINFSKIEKYNFIFC